MELTDVQKDAMRKWVAEGAGISEIQRRLVQQFELHVTYMDLRFLLLDLGLDVKDKERKAPVKAKAASDLSADADADGLPGAEQAIGSAVQVEVDRVVKPGAVASGTVRFSDGVSARWSLDQMGRLGLEGARPGYRPSDADVQAFQEELSRLLQKRGF